MARQLLSVLAAFVVFLLCCSPAVCQVKKWQATPLKPPRNPATQKEIETVRRILETGESERKRRVREGEKGFAHVNSFPPTFGDRY